MGDVTRPDGPIYKVRREEGGCTNGQRGEKTADVEMKFPTRKLAHPTDQLVLVFAKAKFFALSASTPLRIRSKRAQLGALRVE